MLEKEVCANDFDRLVQPNPSKACFSALDISDDFGTGTPTNTLHGIRNDPQLYRSTVFTVDFSPLMNRGSIKLSRSFILGIGL